MASKSLLSEADILLSVHLEPSELATLLGWVLATLGAYALPIAFVFGVMLALARMSADGELLALRASGLGLRQLVLPVLALSCLVTALDAWFFIDVENRAIRGGQELLTSIAARGAFIEPGRFLRLGEFVVYVGARDRDNRLRDIVVSDPSSARVPYVLFSERGRFRFDPDTAQFRFELRNGEIHFEPRSAGHEYRRLHFHSLEYALDAGQYLRTGVHQRRPRGMSVSELRTVVQRARHGDPLADLAEKNPVEYELQLQRRLALPWAPIPLGLLAVALSTRRIRASRAWGMLACVGLVLANYLFVTFSEKLSVEGWLPPVVAFWVPNAVLLGAAVLLLRRSLRPEP